MSDIERFHIQCWSLNKRENGHWVRYDDHRAEVERLKALIVSQHEVVQWAEDGWPVAMEDHEQQAIEAIVQEAQEREQREAAAKGGRDE